MELALQVLIAVVTVTAVMAVVGHMIDRDAANHELTDDD